MPGTHLLPPNLLKLFAPRPPLPYVRPAGKDVDRITKKNVTGVGPILEMLRESKTAGMMSTGEAEDMEDGEEPSFTYAEETKRQIRREDRKKKKAEEFKIAKETCESQVLFSPDKPINLALDKPADDAEAVGDPYKTLFIARLVRALYNFSVFCF
jgi:U1 small nuclear ribonucleoprotein